MLAKLFSPFTLLCALVVAVSGAPAPASTTADPITEIEGIGIGDILNLLGLGLVTQINVFITLNTLVTNLVSVNFDVKNPLPFELTLNQVFTESGVDGIVYAEFDQSFTDFVVPAFGTANSGTFPNVTLTQGAIASMGIILLGELDIITTNVQLHAATIDGKLGIPLSVDGLKQTGVPTNYTVSLS